MSFVELPFFIFLPIVFVLYWHVLGGRTTAQNVLLLVASYLFYAWWDARFLSLIVLSTFIDFLCAKYMYQSQEPITKKRLLWLSITVNLAILGFFKYCNFFVQSAQDLLNSLGVVWSTGTLNVVLPLGISFYTFQSMSYTIDVYCGRQKPTKSLLNFATYVAFFPQLVAGPIERASHLLPQFARKRSVQYQQLAEGGRQILWGFFKKVVVADNCAKLVTDTYGDLSLFDHSGITLWMTLFYFSVQIYCDFSGYSDIAIGLAKWFGIELNINFRTPYFSKNLVEFWKRWHISLSTWFRDYVYIPLGGNKVGRKKWAWNILAVFLLSGLWHGAHWRFVVWGGIHGMGYLLFILVTRRWKILIPNWLSVAVTFMFVTWAWAFFRARDLAQAWEMIYYSMVHFAKHPGILPELILKVSNVFLLIWLFFEIRFRRESFQFSIANWTKPLRWTIYILMLVVVVYNVIEVEPQAFIYFRF